MTSANNQAGLALSTVLTEILKDSGLSLEQAAYRTRFSPSTLSRWMSGVALPRRSILTDFLTSLGGVSRGQVVLLHRLRDAAAEELARASADSEPPGDDVVVNGGAVTINGMSGGASLVVNDGAVTLNGGVSAGGRTRDTPPPLVKDAEGRDCKPDPARASTPQEFVAVMGDFRRWAGRHSTRNLARWSGGVFSHTTIAGVLNGTVRATFPYVQGFIRACGADETEVALWSTVYRHVYEGLTPNTAGTTPAEHNAAVPLLRRIFSDTGQASGL